MHEYVSLLLLLPYICFLFLFLFFAVYLKQILYSYTFFFLFCTVDGFISNNSEFLFVPCMNLKCVCMCGSIFATMQPTAPHLPFLTTPLSVVLLKSFIVKICVCVCMSIICSKLCLACMVHVVYRARSMFFKRFTIFHLVLFPVLEIHALLLLLQNFCSIVG